MIMKVINRGAVPVSEHMMSPRDHYAAATRLMTEGLDKVSNEWAIARTVDVARVHAILATVPQSQFDAWKRETASETREIRETDPAKVQACDRCGRALYMVRSNGHIVQPTLASQWSWEDGKAACAEDDPDGCYVRAQRLSQQQLLQPGDTPCSHYASPSRCERCHLGKRPHTVCGACGIPCWNAARQAGSRCDLPGCAGLMVDWPGPRP
jgi:ribosomal protein L32